MGHHLSDCCSNSSVRSSGDYYFPMISWKPKLFSPRSSHAKYTVLIVLLPGFVCIYVCDKIHITQTGQSNHLYNPVALSTFIMSCCLYHRPSPAPLHYCLRSLCVFLCLGSCSRWVNWDLNTNINQKDVHQVRELILKEIFVVLDSNDPLVLYPLSIMQNTLWRLFIAGNVLGIVTILQPFNENFSEMNRVLNKVCSTIQKGSPLTQRMHII